MISSNCAQNSCPAAMAGGQPRGGVWRAATGTAAPRRRLAAAPRCQQTAAAVDLQQAAAASGTGALFQPLQMGPYTLKHRVVMAPLTRNRALDGTAQPNMVEYYRQRATDGGLIISEATRVCEEASGYPCTPGLFTPAQVESWKPVVQAVHDQGGLFFSQLWHCGRASHPDYQPGGVDPVAPSAVPIAPPFQVLSPKTWQWLDYPTPRALEKHEIGGIIQQFRTAARNALAAGADGVELHAASGYLINQFLQSSSNQRTDEYGGTIENRCRFALELTEAVCEEVGAADKVAIRFSPFGYYLISPDPHTYALYSYLLTEISKFGLAYVHLVEPRGDDIPVSSDVSARPDTLAPFRQVYSGTLIVAGGHKGPSAAKAVESDAADAVAFGRYYISNPDLVRRIALAAPLNQYDRDTFYSQGNEGYIDYPALEDTPEGQAFLAGR